MPAPSTGQQEWQVQGLGSNGDSYLLGPRAPGQHRDRGPSISLRGQTLSPGPWDCPPAAENRTLTATACGPSGSLRLGA